MKTKLILIIVFSFFRLYVQAQHEHGSDVSDEKKQKHHMEMSGIIIGTPMSMDSSGTSWVPQSSLMHAYDFTHEGLELMFHGNVFLRYTNQNINKSGKRGDSQFDSPNWFMIMMGGNFTDRDRLALRLMVSLDRLTEGGNGYPLLFQNGETWKGVPLTDRQHPHDLFSETSVTYSHLFSGKTAFFLYAGFPGEPAIGPATFMHRPSAQNIPDAPLGHHWQDSTHITFGVLTAGFVHRGVKIDFSSFTGREPDENRLNFDSPKFDSMSGRITVNPAGSLSFQGSYAFIKSPEPAHPGDIQRLTASALVEIFSSSGIRWSSALIWGLNTRGWADFTNSYLVETNFSVHNASFFGRIELIQKEGEELNLQADSKKYLVNAFSLGAAYQIIEGPYGRISIGAMGTGYIVPEGLKEQYGKNPFSAEFFVRLYPN